MFVQFGVHFDDVLFFKITNTLFFYSRRRTNMRSSLQSLILFVILGLTINHVQALLQDDLVESRHLRSQPVNVDKLFDKGLSAIRKLINQKGLDPVQITDASMPITELPGALAGSIELTKGWLQNFSTIKRTGPVTVQYTKGGLLTLDLTVGFDSLDATYQYLLKYLLIKRQGDVNVNLKNVSIRAIVTLDLPTKTIMVQEFKIERVGKLSIHLDGHLTDKLINIMTKIITTFGKNLILKEVEFLITEIIYDIVDNINDSISSLSSTVATRGFVEHYILSKHYAYEEEQPQFVNYNH